MSIVEMRWESFWVGCDEGVFWEGIHTEDQLRGEPTTRTSGRPDESKMRSGRCYRRVDGAEMRC